MLLIVDDENDFRDNATAFLSTSGYHVLASRDLPATRDLISRLGSEVDVVLVDLSLGSESGFDLIRSVAERGQGPPTIAFSGTQNEASLESSLAMGASAILRKPVDISWCDTIERVKRRA